jgi:hypothetical protein
VTVRYPPGEREVQVTNPKVSDRMFSGRSIAMYHGTGPRARQMSVQI